LGKGIQTNFCVAEVQLDCRNAALQHYGMQKILPVSKRGTITLPPSFRKKLGLDQLENPLLIVEEKQGRLVMEVATAVPVREFSDGTLGQWIAEDEADGAAIRKARRIHK